MAQQPIMPRRPPQHLELVRITFQKGIDQSQEATMLAEGYLTDCQNWIPEPTGELRCDLGWRAGNKVPPVGDNLTYYDAGTPHTVTWPASKKVRGMLYVPMSVGVDDTPGGKWWFVAMKHDVSNYPQVWASRAYDDLHGGWRIIRETQDTAINLDSIPMAFAKGNSAVLFGHPKMAGLLSWGGNIPPGPVVITDTTSKTGRALAFHKSRFYMGGGDGTTPYRLFFTDLGSFTSWPTNNFIDVGLDDAEPIEDLAPFQNELFVGKESGLFVLAGSGLDTFNLQKLEGANCSPGRCLIPTAAGLFILGRHEAWVFRGGIPELISPAVQTDYEAGSSSWRMGFSVGSKLFVASFADNTRMLEFDTIRGVWTTDYVGDELEQFVSTSGHLNRLVGGPRESNMAGPLAYRDVPQGPRVKDFDPLTPIYLADASIIFPASIEGRITPRFFWIRVRQRTGASSSSTKLICRAFCDGQQLGADMVIDARAIPAGEGSLVFTEEFQRGGITGRSLQLHFEQQSSIGGALFDVEAMDVGLDRLEMR